MSWPVPAASPVKTSKPRGVCGDWLTVCSTAESQPTHRARGVTLVSVLSLYPRLLKLTSTQVLRTVYTEESDVLFSRAIEQLERWMTRHYLHISRFPMWEGRKLARPKPDGTLNEELARRFRIEVIEDKDKLDFPSLEDATFENIKDSSRVLRSMGRQPRRDTQLGPTLLERPSH